MTQDHNQVPNHTDATDYQPEKKDLPVWGRTGVCMTPALARALIEFSCCDSDRAIYGVSHDSDYSLLATDGRRCLLADDMRSNDDPGRCHRPKERKGRTWSRSYVNQQVAIARANKTRVTLEYSARLKGIEPPDIRNVVPDAVVALTEPPWINANYLVAVDTLRKAATSMDLFFFEQAVRLTGITGPLDPFRFETDTEEKGMNLIAVVMPVRGPK